MNACRTPYYIFDANVIRANLREMVRNLQACEVHYSLKPNSELAVLRVLIQESAHFEVASDGEFDRLLELGANPDSIICSLPVKPASMVDHLYRNGCSYFVFDSYDEYSKLRQFAGSAKKVLRVHINHLVPHSIPFGMAYEEFQCLLATDPGFAANVDGITFAIPYEWHTIHSVMSVLAECERYLSQLGADCRILNIGGGYALSQNCPVRFYDVLTERLERMRAHYGLEIYAEPGRAIVQTAGELRSEVALVKRRGTYNEIFIDAGQQTKVSYKPCSIALKNRLCTPMEAPVRCKFFGTLCSHTELFEADMHFDVRAGDILAFEHYGAYSICFSNRWHGAYLPETSMVDSVSSLDRKLS